MQFLWVWIFALMLCTTRGDYVYTCENIRRIYRESGCCVATSPEARQRIFLDMPSNLACLSCQGVYEQVQLYCMGNPGGSERRLAIPSTVCDIRGCVLPSGTLNQTIGSCPIFVPEEQGHTCYHVTYFSSNFDPRTNLTTFCSRVENSGGILGGGTCPSVSGVWLNDVLEPGYRLPQIIQTAAWYNGSSLGIGPGGARSLCMQLSCEIGLFWGTFTLNLVGNITVYGRTKLPFCLPAGFAIPPGGCDCEVPPRTSPSPSATQTHATPTSPPPPTTPTQHSHGPTPTPTPAPSPPPPLWPERCPGANSTVGNYSLPPQLPTISGVWQSIDQCIIIDLESVIWNVANLNTIMTYVVSTDASSPECAFDILGWMLETSCAASTATGFISALPQKRVADAPQGMYFEGGAGVFRVMVAGLVGLAHSTVYVRTTRKLFYKGSLMAPVCPGVQTCMVYLAPATGNIMWAAPPFFLDPTYPYMISPEFREITSYACSWTAPHADFGAFPEMVSLIRYNPTYLGRGLFRGEATWRMGPLIPAGAGCSLGLDHVAYNTPLNLTIANPDRPFFNQSMLQICDEARNVCKAMNSSTGIEKMRITSTLFFVVTNGASVTIHDVKITTRAAYVDGGPILIFPPQELSLKEAGVRLPQTLSSPSALFAEDTFASTYLFWPQEASRFSMRFSFWMPNSASSAPGVKIEFVEGFCPCDA